jgi:hypothetical protein
MVLLDGSLQQTAQWKEAEFTKAFLSCSSKKGDCSENCSFSEIDSGLYLDDRPLLPGP